MDITRALKDGLNWFLITANGVILFLSINSLENLATNQQDVISAFECGAQALSQNADALRIGAETLENFGTYIAASVCSAGDAFGNFEGILDKHIELAKLQGDVIQKQGLYLQRFTEGMFRLHLPDQKPKYSPSFGNDNIDNMESLYGISRDECIKFMEDLEKIEKETKKQNLKKSVQGFKAQDPSFEVMVASNRTVDPSTYPDNYTREHFSFGNIPYDMTKKLSVFCALYVMATEAHNYNAMSDDLYQDVVEVLGELSETEADKIEGELARAGWVLAKKLLPINKLIA